MTNTKKTPNKTTKVKPKVKPLTPAMIKQKAVLANLTRNIGKGGKKVTMTQAMVEAGYSKSYAQSGSMLKQKTWTELVAEFLPDTLLAQTHNELIGSKRLDVMDFDKKTSDETITELLASVGNTVRKIMVLQNIKKVYFWTPDGRIRKEAVDMAYKVKGNFAPDKVAVELSGLQAMSDDELEALITKQSRRFKKLD